MIFAIIKFVNMITVTDAYRRAQKRLLLLDYDGTLAEFNVDPMGATPSPELLEILQALTSDPANTVVVISGRPSGTLDAWLGHLPLSFSAEHGFLHKKPCGEWETISSAQDDWKKPVRDLMESYVRKVPGTSLEEKVSALTWHWRAAKDSEAAQSAEQDLLASLKTLAGPLQLRVLRIIRGNKVIEVHPQGFDKGTGGNYWLDQSSYDFVLAAGDDTTDEDLFKAMPENSFVIKVGPGPTVAHLHLENPAAMRQALRNLYHSDV